MGYSPWGHMTFSKSCINEQRIGRTARNRYWVKGVVILFLTWLVSQYVFMFVGLNHSIRNNKDTGQSEGSKCGNVLQ